MNDEYNKSLFIESEGENNVYSDTHNLHGTDEIGQMIATDFPNWINEYHDGNPAYNTSDSNMYNYGYNFRLPGGTRAFVGRSSWEHEMLRQSAREDDLILQPCGMDNPVVLCRDISWNNDILLAAGILVSFALTSISDIEIAAVSGQGKNHILHGIRPVDITLLEKWKIDTFNYRNEALSDVIKA